ncbi:MAG TPA: serine hydrolase domain-containing protein, partial [Bacteroidota bacterium]
MKIRRTLFILGALVGLTFLLSIHGSPGKLEKPRVLTAFDSLVVRYDAYIDDYLAERNAPGAAVAIVKDDRIVYLRGFGSRKVGGGEQVDTNTVFRIASLSKGFASALTALLVQDSVLRWDDRVVNYLPKFSLKKPANTRTMTIRHLLSHTTGLVPNAFDNLVEANVSLDVLTTRLREAPILYGVGEHYSYQNVAYCLIAPIVES